jgi:ACS family sodium-dependent inorganic phosphate cotransporter
MWLPANLRAPALVPETACEAALPQFTNISCALLLLRLHVSVCFVPAARNVPTSKRSTAVGVITAASYAGTALAFGLSPLLITRLGWQWVFYLFGGAALVWLPFWLPLNVYGQFSEGSSSSRGSRGDKPSSSDGAAVEQQSLLGAAAGSSSGAAATGSSGSGAVSTTTGFGALLRRREVWAICVCQYAQSYGLYSMLAWLPTFFSEYYEVQVGDLGGYTLLPYFVQGVVGLGTGALADQMLTQWGWSVRSVRVGLQLAGMLGPAACLVAAVSPLVGGSATAASALITVGLGLSALSLGAVSVNHLDIAPRNAGMVFGAGNTAATLAGLVSVPLTGWLLQRTASWPLVFGLIAAHFVVGSAIWAAWVGDKPLPEDGPDLPALAP